MPDRRDEHAQMMLLTAFILVIGFVALAGMSARVTQLPDETRQALDRPIMNEANAVVAAVEHTMDRLAEEVDVSVAVDQYEVELETSLQYLVAVEKARGFHLSIDRVDCVTVVTPPDDDARIEVEFTLTSVETQASFTSQKTFVDTPCTPP